MTPIKNHLKYYLNQHFLDLLNVLISHLNFSLAIFLSNWALIERRFGLTLSMSILSALGKMELTGEMSWDLFLAPIKAESKKGWRSIPGALGSEFL